MLLQMTLSHSFYDWVIFRCISIPYLLDFLLSLDSTPFFQTEDFLLKSHHEGVFFNQSSLMVPCVCLVPASHCVPSLFNAQCLWGTICSLLKRWEYWTTLPVSWETCMQVKKQHLEPDMKQQTGSKLEKEYIRAVYCHPAYLTYAEYIMWNVMLDEAQAAI